MITVEPLPVDWKIWLFLGVLVLSVLVFILNIIKEKKQLKRMEAMLRNFKE